LSKDKKESKLKIAQQIAKKSIDVYPNCAELWNRRTSISTNIDDGHVIISYEEDFSTEKLYEISIKKNPISSVSWDSYLNWIYDSWKNKK
jgi:hypothetical protein